MLFKRRMIAAVFVLVILFGSLGRFAFADIATDPASSTASDAAMQQVQDQKKQLQTQLEQIESQIAQYEKDLGSIKGQKNTLQNKITQLKKQQASLALQMKATTLQLKQMDAQLTDTQKNIDVNRKKTDALKQQIAEDLRIINQNDHETFLFTLLSQNTLFDALSEVQKVSQLSEGLDTLLEQVRKTNASLEDAKKQLSDQQDQVSSLLSIQQLQQEKILGSVSEQNTLLTQTKGKEKNYQAQLSDTQKQAAAIRTRLYQLLDVGKQITFGQAAADAQWVSSVTGVRAAFVLAILTQESNLGKNVGTCNRPGDPPSKSWKVIMKPDRDQVPFAQITKDLGLDPDTTQVSCPMHDKNGNQIGWGGAMGPAQFIPSTWMGYKNKVTAITGKTANPWDIRDAFLASAIKLAADGGTTIDGEWAAAMRYFSGGTNVRYRFYGDNVVATAAQYQKDLDALAK